MSDHSSPNSELDLLIPPEIKDDELYSCILRLSREAPLANVLEIGSSSGGGSTEAFVTGLRHNPGSPRLFCMEVSIPRFEVLGWLRQDRNYIAEQGVPENGIRRIRVEHGIELFDMVLIDGSEFLGVAELNEVYGAGIIVLDDVNGYKNYYNYQRLRDDSAYWLVQENLALRNGFAIFIRR
jgi:hypothetical protein